MSWLLSLLKSPFQNTSAADLGGDPSPARLAAQELAAALPAGRVCFPGDGAYRAEVRSYWSSALHDLRPACVVFPESAGDVSAAVRLLRRHPGVAFAVKSGGHDPNPGGGASVGGGGGVLVSLARMAGAAYVEEDRCALVRPGGRWIRVVEDLEPHGVTVLGGRLACVGVGGYLVQGGLSFLSAEHGLAADNIVGWETVQPDGSIVDVDAKTQPELAKAMRGGGNQFGIVTQFRIKTHSIGKVWGGIRFYRKSHEDALLSALHDFIPDGNKDPRAAVSYTDIMFFGGSVICLYLFYDSPTPPSTGPFAEFLKVPCTVDWAKSRSYSDLLRIASWLMDMSPVAGRMSFRSVTIPYVPSNSSMYREIATKWSELCAPHNRFDCFHPWPATNTVSLQPFPSAIGRHSEAAGGNAMGLSGSDPDRLVVEIQCMWHKPEEDEVLRDVSRAMAAWLEERRPGWLAEARADVKENTARADYMPLFMNDAASDQDVVGSYREYESFKALQQKVDPEGMFRTRLGGFKY